MRACVCDNGCVCSANGDLAVRFICARVRVRVCVCKVTWHAVGCHGLNCSQHTDGCVLYSLSGVGLYMFSVCCARMQLIPGVR